MKHLNIGDHVIAIFLGSPEPCEVIEVTDKKNKLDKEMNSELVKDFILAFPDAKLTSVTEEEDA